MGKSSQYNQDLYEKKLEKFKELCALLPEYTHPYLDNLLIDYQPNTLIAYARDLVCFFEYLKEMNPLFKDLPISAIPLEAIQGLVALDIIEYRNYLAFNNGVNKHANQASSIDRRMSPLRGLFASLVDLGYCKNDPTAHGFGRKRKRADKKQIVYLEQNEVRDFINIVETSSVSSEHQHKILKNTSLRDTAILTLLLNTGIRVSECVGIDLDDLNLTEGSVRVVRKGGNEQTVYFGPEVSDTLLSYIKHERPRYCKEADEKALFLSSQKRRMSVRAIEYMVKKYAAEAVPGKRISPHKMRSTYGTALYDRTSDIRLVADVLGHEDVTTTARHYASVKEKHRKEAGKISLF